MNLLFYLIVLPFIAGLLCLFIPKLKEIIAVITSLGAFIITILVFFNPGAYSLSTLADYLRLDKLSGFILLAIGFFGFFIVLYSLKYMSTIRFSPKILKDYYCYTLWTLGAAFGVVLANNLVLLLVFWGFLGLTLYLLINMGSDATAAAKKTFIIIGGSDCLMVAGIAIIWVLTGTFQMDKITISLAGVAPTLAVVAFLCLAVGSFAKAGAMPFHTWIPDMAEVSPIPVTAFLPASLDKLLGIYLLARICMDLFRLSLNLNLLLLIVGSITIIAAVFMAMIQHDMKKLLSYHAVSQVGYMVLGIGTGTMVGIAGGIFHMLNHAIYKACLFLCSGAVEHKVGHTDLDKLGGLGKLMPVTFFTCLVASLSISGVPPFNGFVSKWMVYQGIINLAQTSSNHLIKHIWWVFLVAAMFGSVLTLASFMKLIHATFLGRSVKRQQSTVKEVHWTMWLPMGVLALLCIVFGVFAFQLPLKHFILPAVSTSRFLVPDSQFLIGIWQPGMATVLILIGIIIGFLIYLLGSIKVREDTTYIGGETLPDEARVTGTDFYQTVKDVGGLKQLYSLAEKKFFDIYNWGTTIVRGLGRFFSVFHTGNLHVYLSWSLIGIIVLLWVMLW